MADFGQALGDNPVLAALGMFKQGVQDLQLSRALSNANDTVQQIKSSEQTEEQKTNQLRNVAQDITFKMANLGADPSQIAGIREGLPPPKPLIQNFDQAMIYGSKEDRKNAMAGEKFKADQKIREEIAKANADPWARMLKINTQRQAFDKASSIDEKRGGAPAAAAATIDLGNKLQANIGAGNSWDDLNKMNRVQVGEATMQYGMMMKSGAITQDEFHAIFPNAKGMPEAKISDFFSGKDTAALAPTNAAAFIDSYRKGSLRQQAVAQDSVQRSILAHASFNSALAHADLPGGEPGNAMEWFKSSEASKLSAASKLPVSPDDIIVDSKGGVTTKDMMAKDAIIKEQVTGAKEAKKQLASTDPAIKAQGLRFLRHYGADEKTSLSDLTNVIRYKVISGEVR